MNISSRDNSCYTNLSPDSYNLSLQMYSDQDQDHHHHHHHQDQANNNNIISSTVANSLLYSLSILKEKVHQLQTLMSIILSPSSSSASHHALSSSFASPPSIHNAVQDIIMTASSMLITFQQQIGPNIVVAPNSGTSVVTHNNNNITNIMGNGVVSPKSIMGQALARQDHDDQTALIDWSFTDHDNNFNTTTTAPNLVNKNNKFCPKNSSGGDNNNNNCDIIELGAADLLAKYTHYCQVCGKGFKRDANLRMHMRAHGDEYKTNMALTNPMNINNNGSALDEYSAILRDRSKKYSCPQEGCRWNQRHAKFQPLKSMICVKNHYKRSHCPKMYVCKRCNRKQFSVLSDLRTHEKHCGDPKWQCSCGTTFSRKDKLMGHVSLFHGHTPVLLNNINNNNNSSAHSSKRSNNNIVNNNKLDSQLLSQVHIDNIVKSMISE